MNGKVQVISAILQIDRPFRPPQIGDITGLPRQLIRYHLQNFITEGVLEQHGKYYSITDKERLLGLLLDASDSVDVSRMQPTTFIFDKGFIGELNSMAEVAICLRSLDPELSGNLRELYAKEIDDSVKELKRLRKFLMNSERSKPSAAKKLKGRDIQETWENLKRVMPQWTTKYDKREWVEAIREAIEE